MRTKMKKFGAAIGIGFMLVLTLGVGGAVFVPAPAVAVIDDGKNPFDAGYLIVCGSSKGSTAQTEPCTVEHVMLLFKRAMTLLFFLTVPVTFYASAYAGFLFLTAQDSADKVDRAKKMFKGVVIGFLIICSAWIAVKTIVDAVLNKAEYETFEVKR